MLVNRGLLFGGAYIRDFTVCNPFFLMSNQTRIISLYSRVLSSFYFYVPIHAKFQIDKIRAKFLKKYYTKQQDDKHKNFALTKNPFVETASIQH